MTFLLILSLQFPQCNEITPLLNTSLLKMVGYEGEGIPNLLYCREE